MKTIILVALVLSMATVSLMPGQTHIVNGKTSVYFDDFFPEGACIAYVRYAPRAAAVMFVVETGRSYPIARGIRLECDHSRAIARLIISYDNPNIPRHFYQGWRRNEH